MSRHTGRPSATGTTVAFLRAGARLGVLAPCSPGCCSRRPAGLDWSTSTDDTSAIEYEVRVNSIIIDVTGATASITYNEFRGMNGHYRRRRRGRKRFGREQRDDGLDRRRLLLTTTHGVSGSRGFDATGAS